MSESKLNLVFLDTETISPQAGFPEFQFKHNLVTYKTTSINEVSERISDAHIVITNKVRINAEAISAAKKLKLISVAATGVDNIDIEACSNAGVYVCNVQDYASITVPEHTFSLIFALRRSLFQYHRSVRKGRWQEANQFCYFDYQIKDLSGSTIGIIGSGSLGTAVAKIANSLGMKVLFAGRKGAVNCPEPYTPFNEVLRQSDILTLHCPLTSTTENLIGAQEFEEMVKKPIIINTARGGLIDEAELINALNSGKVSGAGLDVTRPEPPEYDSAFMKLAAMDNVIVTPHVGWASEQAVKEVVKQVELNVHSFVQGNPRNIVNKI